MNIKNNINVLIPMAGLGTRIKDFDNLNPKPLVVVDGKTLIEHSLDSFLIDAHYIFITRKYDNLNYNKKLTKIFDGYGINYTEINIDYLPNGATNTALCAKEYINNKNPLIILNCDQLFNWNPMDFINSIDDNIDGAVVLYKSDDPKNSFANIKNNRIIAISEKIVTSNDALVGIHYWKHGKDFVESAQELLKNNTNKECFISETYNYLTQNKYIVPYYINNNQFIPLGTSEDIEKYIRLKKEYYSEKPKTIFCDIDGTILKHEHSFSNVVNNSPKLLPEVLKKFDEWDSFGHKIILTTARKESSRKLTENQLNVLGISWDQLIMGVSSGERILINDKYLENDKNRATSINVITNFGFKNIRWEDYGL